MAIEYLGLSEINGPLVALEGVKDCLLYTSYVDGWQLKRQKNSRRKPTTM